MNNAIQQYLEKHGFGHIEPKAVLFDMDGVIYDSMPNHAISWHEAMKDYGLDMPPEAAYLYEGMRGIETIKLLARQQWGRELSDEDAQEMYVHKSDLFASRVKHTPALIMPGIHQLMEHIKDDGLLICIVTGSGQGALLDRLMTDFHGLLSKERMVTAFDVKQGKPAPDPYIAGLSKCGIRAEEAIVVENAPLGIQSAKAAHCFTIAVNTGPLPDSTLLHAGADIVMPTIHHLEQEWNKK